jgi:hypothetical protein
MSAYFASIGAASTSVQGYGESAGVGQVVQQSTYLSEIDVLYSQYEQLHQVVGSMFAWVACDL